MINEIYAKRLAIIRHLYEKGVELSHLGEPTNALAILPFHDSVEMFMKLCAEIKAVRVERNTSFMQYFSLLPDLKGKAQMDNLNNRRVSLKHHGQLPSSIDVEISRVNVADFFNQNTPIYFGCKLEDVSLEILITYTSVRNYLSKYRVFMKEGKYGDAQAQCQIAFIELLNEYCKQYDRGLDLVHSPATNAYYLKHPNIEDKTDKCIENIKDDLIKINEAINIMNMGINYFKYSEFKAMGPSITKWNGDEGKEYDYYIMNIDFYDKKSADTCYNFVVNCALQFQNKKLFI